MDDLERAELEIIRHFQKNKFLQEITTLKKDEPVKRGSHKLEQIL